MSGLVGEESVHSELAVLLFRDGIFSGCVEDVPSVELGRERDTVVDFLKGPVRLGEGEGLRGLLKDRCRS